MPERRLRRPGFPEDNHWPQPAQLPLTPAEDVGRILKLILGRLDAIEKRVANIEKMLIERQPPVP